MPKAKPHSGRRQRQHELASSNDALMPAAVTYFRTSIRSPGVRELMDSVLAKLTPLEYPQDREIAQQVTAAQTPQELIRLAGVVKRASEAAWHKRLEAYGPAVIVPVIERRLKTYQSISDEEERGKAVENLVTALRWQGDAGAQALLACFNNLDDYGQSMACVVLGLLRASAAADVIWRYFQRVLKMKESYFVGALWGLIDLHDSHAADALDETVRNGHNFYEFFGFEALAGDARAVLPLIGISAVSVKDKNDIPLMALAAVTQRIGREACIAQIDGVKNTPDEARHAALKVIDVALTMPQEVIEQTFDLFYHDITPRDVGA